MTAKETFSQDYPRRAWSRWSFYPSRGAWKQRIVRRLVMFKQLNHAPTSAYSNSAPNESWFCSQLDFVSIKDWTLVLLDKSPAFIDESVPNNAFFGLFYLFGLLSFLVFSRLRKVSTFAKGSNYEMIITHRQKKCNSFSEISKNSAKIYEQNTKIYFYLAQFYAFEQSNRSQNWQIQAPYFSQIHKI